ncbi:putative odorant-binding protein A10 [Pogonomyrmex barbatus]|uniref:Odorant-binding protein A10 n=1 Tax=Pogonomyrmex barbatus TaxID=144034 RepID=A0A6I9WVB0_9HYME|nr:putative odorant-binding protein A10 [Pogonomyrmex barbatus]
MKIEETMDRLSYIVMCIDIALMCVLAEELYSDKFDDIEIMDILQNDAPQNEYYNCFVNTGPCVTDVQKYFREIFPEIH